MRFTVTFLEGDYDRLSNHLTANPRVEAAAFIMCKLARTDQETRLLVREVISVDPDDIIEASSVHMRIAPRAYTRALKRADDTKCSFVFVHSHPNGLPHHSDQDDVEEGNLFRTAHVRVHSPQAHASLIFANQVIAAGRVWHEDGSCVPIERIRVIGKRFRFFFPGTPMPEQLPYFDRQVRAFGKDTQALLSRLTVGLVAAGGTGSCEAEQLIRLGVGHLIVSDGQTFDHTNVNRVYGSRVIDQDIPKVKLTQRLAADIGVGTKVTPIGRPITFESVLREFRNCDIIFGCTDDEWGRSLLTRFAILYGVPIFDLGVKVDSTDQTIRSIQGRVTTLMPGAACLYCRDRISPERIRVESLRVLNPDQAEQEERDGYIPRLDDPAPAVIPFTSTVASTAIIEFLHRLTGCLGEDRQSTEVIHLFDDTRVRTNHKVPREDCFCADKAHWNRGDLQPFLDTTWRPE